MKTPDVPDDFVEIKTDNDIIWMNSRYADALQNAGLVPFDSFVQKYEVQNSTSYSGRGPLQTLEVPDIEPTVLHRHYLRGGLLRFLNRDLYMPPPRPFREIIVSEALRKKGIKTIDILVGRAAPAFGPFHRADLLMTEIPEPRDVQSLLLRNSTPLPEKQRQALQKSIGIFCSHLHESGLHHADLHPKNMVLSGPLSSSPHPDRLYIVDLDKARIRDPLPQSTKINNLLRLHRYLEKLRHQTIEITRTDICRIVHAYLSEQTNLPDTKKNILRRGFRKASLHRCFWPLFG